MPDTIYSVTLPDGSTATRKSPRPYTHAIVGVITEVERSIALERLEAERQALEAKIPALRAAAAEPAALEAYAAARAKVDLLEEPVTEICQRHDGTSYEGTHPRWLSDVAFPNGGGRTAVDAAHRALRATPGYLLEEAEHALRAIPVRVTDAENRLTVGEAQVFGWSMSAGNAAKAAGTWQKHYPHRRIFVTDEIAARVPAPRVRKAKS